MRIRRTNSSQMRLEKMLHEFPWLWAVHEKWGAYSERIFISTASLEVLKGTRQTLSFDDMWVKVRQVTAGGTWVLQVPFTNMVSRYPNVAGYALGRAGVTADEVEAIVTVKMTVDIGWAQSIFTIYRERKNGELHRLCLEAVKGMPELRPLSTDAHLMLANDGI